MPDNPFADENRPPENAANPYADTSPIAAEVVSPLRKTPGFFLAVCVVAIVFGTFGMIGGVIQLGNSVFGEAMQDMLSGINTAGPPEARKLQQDMQDAFMDVNRRFKVVNIVLSIVKMTLAFMLIHGGIQSLRRKPKGRSVLVVALVLAAVFELVSAIPTLMTQMAIAAVSSQLESEFGEIEDKAAKATAEFGLKMTQFGVIFGAVIAVVYGLVKFIFFLVSARYLRSPTARALFT